MGASEYETISVWIDNQFVVFSVRIDIDENDLNFLIELQGVASLLSNHLMSEN